MNNKFYNLPIDRQKQILSGALKVFSASSYSKTSTIEIAREAGISKGLIFHYFKNKKELYLYLYKYCVDLYTSEMKNNYNFEETDFFEILLQSQRSKCKFMKEHPYVYAFVVRVYLEDDPELVEEIAEYAEPVNNESFKKFFEKIDLNKFKESVDVALLFKSLRWCSDGFMRDAFKNNSSIDEIESEFASVLEMHKQNFYKEEFLCTSMSTETEKIIL